MRVSKWFGATIRLNRSTAIRRTKTHQGSVYTSSRCVMMEPTSTRKPGCSTTGIAIVTTVAADSCKPTRLVCVTAISPFTCSEETIRCDTRTPMVSTCRRIAGHWVQILVELDGWRRDARRSEFAGEQLQQDDHAATAELQLRLREERSPAFP